MINVKTVEVLRKKGFPMPDILKTVNEAEKNGEAALCGYVVRFNASGEMIVLHPSWCGIYAGDYGAHIIFQKNISYSCGRFGFMSAKHSDLEKVLENCRKNSTTEEILCECCADSFSRRRKQIEKLGYSVVKSNISACEKDWSTCYFIIKSA